MTLPLTSLTAVTLSLAWHAEQDTTYSIQTADNLFDWISLPFVISGNGQEEFLSLESENELLFARLRYSDVGDTNENGLPDMWEWQQFGYLDVDPDADPDGDGRSNYSEWLDDTDPLDFYDGKIAVVHLSSGTEWLVPAGQVSQQEMYITVTDPSGNPWPGAPVTLAMESGEPRIISREMKPSAGMVLLVQWTNELGQIHPDHQSIQVRSPEIPWATDTVVVRTGNTIEHVLIRSIGSEMGGPPRQLKREILDTGILEFSWSGPADDASGFLVQERDSKGDWQETVNVATVDLPPPDPVDGRYRLTVQLP